MELQPDYANVHNNLGNALANHGELEAAISHFQIALEINPDYSDAHNNLANALASRGQVDEAVTHYRRAWKSSPTMPRRTPTLETHWPVAARSTKPSPTTNEPCRSSPESADAHNNLGVVLAARGQTDAAIAHYRKAVEIKPDYVEAYNNLGIASARRGNIDQAIAYFRKALAINPDYAAARKNLGMVLPEWERLKSSPGNAR